MRLLLIGMLLAGFGANAMDAQTKTPGPLASYKSFKCSFPTYATARWTDPPQASVASQTLTFGISGIDAKKRQASIVGSTVTVPAALVVTQTGLTVIEQTPIGNVNITTVFVAGGTGTKFLAVHSRHIGDTSGTPTASQNYGSCDAAQ